MKTISCSICGQEIEGGSTSELTAARDAHMTAEHDDEWQATSSVVSDQQDADIEKLFKDQEAS